MWLAGRQVVTVCQGIMPLLQWLKQMFERESQDPTTPWWCCVWRQGGASVCSAPCCIVQLGISEGLQAMQALIIQRCHRSTHLKHML